MTDSQNMHTNDLIKRAQARIEKMNQAARALTEELGLPPEAECDVLSTMYADRVPLEGTGLGVDIRTGEYVTVSQEERLRGLYILGEPGMGKSGLLANLIEHDIQQNLGVCLLDPHGDLIEHVLSRLPASRENDVILLDVQDEAYAFGLNLFQGGDLKDVHQYRRTASFVMGILAKLFSGDASLIGPVMTEVLLNCVMTLVENPGCTLAEIPLFFQNEDARVKLVENVTNEHVRHFWHRYDRMKLQDRNELIAFTFSIVNFLLMNPTLLHIFGQSKTTIDFRRIMDERKILLVKLSRRDSVVTTLVGAAVVGLVLEAALSRADLPPKKRRPFHVYVDEFQRFATQDMAVLLTEGRKFAIATTVAHQFRDQLDHANRAATLNATNLVVFRVTGEDREELASLFSPASLAEAERDTGDQRTYVDKRNKIERSLASLQKYVAHVKVGGSEYTVATRPPKEGHSSLEREARLKQIQNQTREKYCKPSSEVDKEIEVRRSLLIRGQLPRTSRPATETPEDLTKPRQRSIEEFGQ